MAQSSASRGLLEIPLRRLRGFRSLETSDETVLRTLAMTFEEIQADAAVEDNPRRLQIVLSGWGCTQQLLRDGRRQLFGLVLPGDSIGELDPPQPKASPAIQSITPMLLADGKRSREGAGRAFGAAG